MAWNRKIILAALLLAAAAAVVWICMAYGGKDGQDMGFLVQGIGKECCHG